MPEPSNRSLLLGVSGGIAAYKSPDLVRRLREQGFDVRVVMTAAAREFITPMTLQAVSGHPVHGDLFDRAAEAAMGHIELARWAGQVLIAPASADLIARLAHGLADDLLATLCLATAAPIALAPAMNRQMWDAPATRANVLTLLDRGVRILGPAEGEQACGEVGPGRMLEPDDLVRAMAGPSSGPLSGVSALVTAGPTREAIDPVRYISNHSSGKMGYAVAAALVEAGAKVVLVSGPTALATPAGADRLDVESAEEMCAEVLARAPETDLLVACAAVADYRPVEVRDRKIKKTREAPALALEPTPDVLARVAALANAPFTVGFAAETEDLEGNARGKLVRKGLDMIAANLVGVADSGFGGDLNALSVYWEGGGEDLGRGPKGALARDLVALVVRRYRAEHPA